MNANEGELEVDTGADGRLSGRPTKERLLVQFLDLAHDVCSRLRHHSQPVVRLSAALLLAASIAACSGSPASTSSPGPPSESRGVPLSQEVRSGLPPAPGRYPVVPGSVVRDTQGLYQFGWAAPDGTRTSARVSSLKLAESDRGEEVEVHPTGDPVLYLAKDSQVRIVDASAATATSGGRDGTLGPAFWYPFHGIPYSSDPYYYSPPRTVPSGSSVEGGARSPFPGSPGSRTIGLSTAVSGRAGGTGSGTAATLKSGATIGGKTGAAEALGASVPKSSTFSAGKSGGGIVLSGG